MEKANRQKKNKITVQLISRLLNRHHTTIHNLIVNDFVPAREMQKRDIVECACEKKNNTGEHFECTCKKRIIEYIKKNEQ